MLEVLRASSQNDVRGWLEGWMAVIERWVASEGSYSEDDSMERQ